MLSRVTAKNVADVFYETHCIYSGLSKSNFKDHYGDVAITQCLGKIAEINEFSASVSAIVLCLLVSILLPMKKLLFWKKMLCSGNLILCRLAKCCDARIFALAAKYHIEPHNVVRSSVARIYKDSFGFIFLN